MVNKKTLSVGEVAKRCGVKVSTLHFYEDKGLISSTRNSGNQRQYSKDTLRRVAIIKVAKKVGITLDEIKSALHTLPNNRTPNIKDWQVLADQWNASLSLRIRHLENLKTRLTGCIGCGCLSMTNCPIYNEDDKLSAQGVGAVLLE